MPDPKRISVTEAQELLAGGWIYLDVRSEAEFDAGHVPGALNLPLRIAGPMGPVDNPDFTSIAEAAFAKDTRIVVGCKTGNRSLRAAKALATAGFGEIAEMRAGFDAARDAFGRLEPGWSRSGLPVETGKPAGQAYADVRRRRAT